MAYPFKNTLAGGTNGSTVTTGNSDDNGMGDALTHVIIGTAASIQYQPLPWGGSGVKITYGTGTSYLRWDDVSATTGDERRIARRPIYLDSDLTANWTALKMYNGGTLLGQLVVVGDGGADHRKIMLTNGTTFVVASKSTDTDVLTAGALALDTLYWAELVFKGGASSSGELSWRLLAADGVTEIEAYTNTAVTTTVAIPDRVRFGESTTSAATEDWLSEIRFETAASGWLGPLSVAAPTLALSDSVQHVIDARASSVPVGSLSYSINQDSGPTVAPSEIGDGLWLVTPHATDTLVYEVTATGSLGGSDSATVDVPPLGTGSSGPRVIRRVMIDGVLV